MRRNFNVKLEKVCNILFILEKEGETICLMAFVDIVNFQMWRKEYDLSRLPEAPNLTKKD